MNEPHLTIDYTSTQAQANFSHTDDRLYQNPSDSVSAPGKLTVQWSSNGESRITHRDMDRIGDAIDETPAGEYRSAFPFHGSYGTVNLDSDGYTLWLMTPGGAFICGELVNPLLARAKGIPASGVVDISRLTPEVQAAIALLLRGK